MMKLSKIKKKRKNILLVDWLKVIVSIAVDVAVFGVDQQGQQKQKKNTEKIVEYAIFDE